MQLFGSVPGDASGAAAAAVLDGTHKKRLLKLAISAVLCMRLQHLTRPPVVLVRGLPAVLWFVAAPLPPCAPTVSLRRARLQVPLPALLREKPRVAAPLSSPSCKFTSTDRSSAGYDHLEQMRASVQYPIVHLRRMQGLGTTVYLRYSAPVGVRSSTFGGHTSDVVVRYPM